MTFRTTFAALASVALLCGAPALAATTTTTTTVTHGTSVRNGVVAHRTKVVHVRKRTTRPRRVLGVKVGHHTRTTKTVRTTTHRSNGSTRTTVRTTH